MKRVLGLDYGSRRVGAAISDGLGLTARPLDVVPRSGLGEALRRWAEEYEIDTVVVGLPTSLAGHEGDSAGEARRLGEEAGEILGAAVVFVDERFTSKLAEGALLESGMKRRARRQTVDKVAAAIILQDYLDRARRTRDTDEDVESRGE